MDPITQGVVGVSATQLVTRRHQARVAALLGMVSGMAADLDVLIRSDSDPLLFLEYHRHFTHALVFIPFGALLCAGVFALLFRRWLMRTEMSFVSVYLYCFAGYATHALLDACTTYGTQLFWPFSDMRVAWNTVSVVDPLFTVPLLLLMLFAVTGRSRGVAIVGVAYALSYLGLGVMQANRATSIAQQLAQQRGHQISQLGVKPSFANLIVWKSVYQHQGRYYVDAVRVGINSGYYTGVSTARLDLATQFPWLKPDTQQALDIARFSWFSNQHLGIDPNNPLRIIDIRYSLLPNQVSGMWGITLNPNAEVSDHVVWTSTRPRGKEARNSAAQLWQMIRGVGMTVVH